MKKSLLLVFSTIALFIWSCRSVDCFNGYKNTNQNPIIGITLNGVDETTAKNMMSNYLELKKNDERPTRQSVWFDKQTFHNIVTLLIKERGYSVDLPDRQDYTDGMRFYFVSRADMVHGHMVNSVVLVSTKNAGADSIEPNLIHHKDYYIHDLSDVLFKNRDTTRGVGEKRPPALVNIIKGQNVYNVYLKHDNDTLTNDPHYTSRQKAHQMANYFGLDTMRTISEWFDIKLLSALDKTTHDGIRIYFVRHKTQYTYRGLIKQTPTQDPDSLKEAFFIIPTIPYGNSGTKHKDNLAAKKSLDELIKSNFYNSKRFSIVRPMIDTIGGDDNGSLCPTNCNSN